MRELGVRPFEFEDVEPLNLRLERLEVPLAILSLAEQCEKDSVVRFGEFFLFESKRRDLNFMIDNKEATL